MRSHALRFLGILVLATVFPVAMVAQASQGLMFGQWKLNVAKSDFGDGPKMMAMSINVTSDTADLIQFEVTATMQNGFNVSYSYKGAADGKEYPIVGSASLYSYTEEPGVVHETQKDPDGTLTRGDLTVTVVKGKKVGTWNYTITNPDGTVAKQKLIFDQAA